MPAKRKPAASASAAASASGGSKRVKQVVRAVADPVNAHCTLLVSLRPLIRNLFVVGAAACIDDLICAYLFTVTHMNANDTSWFSIAKAFVLDPDLYPHVEAQYTAQAELVVRDGVASIPVFSELQRQTVEHSMDDAVSKMPEYVDPVNTKHLVAGGFGALNNASSFHNLAVRQLRLDLHWVAVALFRQVYLLLDVKNKRFDIPSRTALDIALRNARAVLGQPEPKNDKPMDIPYLEQLIDRMMWRHPDKIPTAEGAHRDASRSSGGDLIFGGWLNCNGFDHALSCVPGSHRKSTGSPTEEGFLKLSQAESDWYKPQMQLVNCLPGEWIVFQQTIVHEVRAVQYTERVKRLFTGWRLTAENQSFMDWLYGNNRAIRSFFVPRIPSGQEPAMYPKSSWVYTAQRVQLSAWSRETFIPAMLTRRVVKNSTLKNETGKEYVVVREECPSLAAIGAGSLYPPYAESELRLLQPSLLFEVPPHSSFSFSKTG